MVTRWVSFHLSIPLHLSKAKLFAKLDSFNKISGLYGDALPMPCKPSSFWGWFSHHFYSLFIQNFYKRKSKSGYIAFLEDFCFQSFVTTCIIGRAREKKNKTKQKTECTQWCGLQAWLAIRNLMIRSSLSPTELPPQPQRYVAEGANPTSSTHWFLFLLHCVRYFTAKRTGPDESGFGCLWLEKRPVFFANLLSNHMLLSTHPFSIWLILQCIIKP